MTDVRRSRDGTRRIVTTASQTSTVKLTPGEIEYLDWLEQKRADKRAVDSPVHDGGPRPEGGV